MSFGSKLKQLREDRGLTQTELADKLGVTLKTISNYETKALALVRKICTRKSPSFSMSTSIFC